jgi:urea transporter
MELRHMAQDLFGVYFTTDDTSDDVSKIRKMKKTGLHTRINGTMPYLTAYLKKLQLPSPILTTILFTEASFRGIAQVYFQNSPLSGLFILCAMFAQSTRVAVHGIIALIAGNLAGVLMGFDKSFLSCGLFGYNSFLVGLALATFYSPEKHEGYYWPVAIGAIIFGYFSSILFVMLGKILSTYKTPPFTMPFNISTIFFLLAVGNMNNVDMSPVRSPELPSYDAKPASKLTWEEFVAGAIRGVGQVFLANDTVAGILVLVGIMICSRISALAALLGSGIGAGVSALVGCDRDLIENGLYGFNPSLTMTSMLMFYVPSVGSVIMGIIASIITVFIQLALATSFEPWGLPVMTLPFCLAALAYIVIQGTATNVISVPLSSMTTPEDHLKRVLRLSKGFDLLLGAIKSSDHTTCHDRSVKTMARRLEKGRSSRRLSVTGLSFAKKNSFLEEEEDTIGFMFKHIDADKKYAITKSQFKRFLQDVGLADEVGLDFACKAFDLMDLDHSGDIYFDEFIAFSQISKHMPEIRRLIIKFFNFVDVNGDHSIKICELDGARSYLGLPPLSGEDQERLHSLCNEANELDFDAIVNFVTIFKLKSIIKQYHQKREQGHDLSTSLHSSLAL